MLQKYVINSVALSNVAPMIEGINWVRSVFCGNVHIARKEQSLC